jgi:hypothetical protein
MPQAAETEAQKRGDKAMLDQQRIETLERRLHGLMRLNCVLLTLFGVSVLGAFRAASSGRIVMADSLSVRELRVVDTTGVVRVRVSADMPDAVIGGRRVHRPEAASGVMLYDDAGQERGGYVTFAPSRTVALTLDTRRSQVAAFSADSAGGAAIGLFEGDDRLEVRASKNTGTGLFVWKNGALAVASPQLSMEEERRICGELKDELRSAEAQGKQKIPSEQVFRACALHMATNACRTCLDKP